jgi:hypothetical protein
LFINPTADSEPPPITEDKFDAGIASTGIIADQRKAGCGSIGFVPLQALRAPLAVESALPPVKLAFLQPVLSAKFPDR